MKRVVLKENHLTKNNHNYLQQYLCFLGVKPEDVDSFIKSPRESDWEPSSNLHAIGLAAQVFHNSMIKDNAWLHVQVDSDTDGYTSSAELIGYAQKRYPNAKITWSLHPGKEHGLDLEKIDDGVTIIVVPDAGSNQFEEQRIVVEEKHKELIILDHHEVSDTESFDNSPAIIVNNQMSGRFANKSLSGAGVVLKFIEYIDTNYFQDEAPIWRDYMDLAAIGIIADAMNMCNLDNNYIAYHGLNHIHSKFIRALGVKQERGIKDPDRLTKMDVMWYIAPVINGVIRSGAPEDKNAVFSAMITDNGEADLYEHTWRGVTKMENIYDHAVRLAANAKSRQDSNKKKAFEWICDKIKSEGLDKNNIIIVTLDVKESSKVGANITGLIAMELVKEFNKPCLVLRKTEFEGKEVFGGSGRNGQFFNLPDLKSALQSSGVYYAEGHGNAFGAFLLPEQIQPITSYFNVNYDAAEFLDEVFEVDYWFHTGEIIDSGMLMDFASASSLYGNSIPAPKFAFDSNIKSSNYFTMGKDNNSLKIRVDGIDFVAFKAADIINKLDDLFTNNDTVHLQIVGHPALNEWNGNVSVQVMIDDIEIIEEANSSNTTDWRSLI